MNVPDGAVERAAPAAGLTTTAIGEPTAAIVALPVSVDAPVAHVAATSIVIAPAWNALSEPNVKLHCVPLTRVAAVETAVVDPWRSVTRPAAGEASVAPAA